MASQWDAWQFILGEWVGEGGGTPGQGAATFTFYPDLQGNVLVRRNRMEFPATEAQPAFCHEDLLIVYQEPGAPTQAIYFDNEGHTIHYTADVAQDGDTIAFISEALPSAPRFRLSYARTSDAILTIRFEMAPPGQPESFFVYTEGTARRK